MKPPKGSKEITITFPALPNPTHDEVYIVFGDYGKSWTLWDPRPVRQGAHMIAYGLNFKQACEAARSLASQAPKQ